MPRATLAFFPRHGTTVANKKNIFRGQEDAPLDDSGLRDAHKLADYLSYPDWGLCFCSPLKRGVQTATIIAAGRGAEDKPQLIEDLKPLNIGEFTGKPKDPATVAAMMEFIRNPERIIPGGESVDHFHDVKRPIFIEALGLGLRRGKPCVVVSHSSLIYYLGELIEGDPQACLVQPGGVAEVFLDDDGTIRARAIFKPARKDDSSFSAAANSS